MTWDTESLRVRVSATDVQGLFAWWVPDDPSKVWRVACRYKLPWDDAQAMYGVSAPVGQSRNKETVVLEVWTNDPFQLWLDESLLEDTANPYSFIPFVIFPNLREPKRFWGQSDLVPLVEPSRELNRAMSQLSTILELSGNPVAVLEGVGESHNTAVQPGAVWELPEKARAYLLDLLQGGGIKLRVDYIDLI